MTISRRLARRGGVKRMSSSIYDDMREAMKERMSVVSIVVGFSLGVARVPNLR